MRCQQMDVAGRKYQTIFVLILIVYLFLIPFVKADDFSLSDYKYRAEINIENTSTGNGDVGFLVVPYNENMQEDYDDIRFTDIYYMPLQYWIENYTTSKAYVWVRLPYSEGDNNYNKKFFMYYGNSSVSSGSNISEMFTFYDNFSDGDYSEWTVNGGTWNASNGYLTSPTGGAAITTNWSGFADTYRVTISPNDRQHWDDYYIAYIRYIDSSYYLGIKFYTYLSNNYYLRLIAKNGSGEQILITDYTYNYYNEYTSWFNVRVLYKGGSTIGIKIWKKGVVEPEMFSYYTINPLYIPSSSGNISLLNGPHMQNTMSDNITAMVTNDSILKIGDTTINPFYTIPFADFLASPRSGSQPLIVQFNDTSNIKDPTGWYWLFGDGNYSTERNISYIYTGAGTYDINFTVSNDSGSWSENRTGYITVTPSGLYAYFTTNVSRGPTPLAVEMWDSSVGNAISYSWDVNNDGIEDRSDKDTIYTFTYPGTYTVNLTVQFSEGMHSSFTRNVVVENNLSPNFTASIVGTVTRSHVGDIIVNFVDTSTGIDISGYYWDFGDSSISYEQNPQHLYTSTRLFTISHCVTNAYGTACNNKTDYINAVSKIYAGYTSPSKQAYVQWNLVLGADGVTAVAINEYGTRIFAGTTSGILYSFDNSSPTISPNTPRFVADYGYGSRIKQIETDKDGKYVLYSTNGGHVYLISGDDGTLIRDFNLSASKFGEITDIDIQPVGSMILITTQLELILYDFYEGKFIGMRPPSGGGTFWQSAIGGGSGSWSSTLKPDWGDIGWDFRIPINLTGSSSGAAYNISMPFMIYRSSGTNSGTNLYVSNVMQPDFRDIMVTFANNFTPINYWIESTSGTTSATVWIKFPYVPPAGNVTTYYLYFGNSIANSLSNKTNAVYFADGFEDPSATGWSFIDSHGDMFHSYSAYSTQWYSPNYSPTHGAYIQLPSEIGNCYYDGHNSVTGTGTWTKDIILETDGNAVYKMYYDANISDLKYCGSGDPKQACFAYMKLNDTVLRNYSSTGIYYSATSGISSGAKTIKFQFYKWYTYGSGAGNGNCYGSIDDIWIVKQLPVLPTVTSGMTQDKYIYTWVPTQPIYWIATSKNSSSNIYLYYYNGSSDTSIFNTTFNTYDMHLLDARNNTVLPGWSMRKAHVIVSYSNLTNYPIHLNVYNTSCNNVDNGENVYACGALPNWNDLRFATGNTTSTFVDYWIENISATHASVWVEMPSLTTGNNILYMYWGNKSAEPYSNVSRVFQYFEDFIRLDRTQWNTTYLNDSIKVDAAHVLNISNNESVWQGVFSNSTYELNRSVRFLGKMTNPYGTSSYGGAGFGYVYGRTPSLGEMLVAKGSDSKHAVLVYNASGFQYTAINDWDSSWHYFEVQRLYGPNAFVIGKKDSSSSSNITSYNIPANMSAPLVISSYANVVYLDWILVRNVTYPEPAHGIWIEDPDMNGTMSYLRLAQTKGLSGSIQDMDLSEDETYLAVSTDTTLYQYDINTPFVSLGTNYSVSRSTTGLLHDVATSDYGSYVVEGNGIIADIYALGCTKVGTYSTGSASITVDIAQKNGLWATTGSVDGKVYIFTKAGSPYWSTYYDSDVTSEVNDVAMSWRGEYVVAGRADGTLVLYRTASAAENVTPESNVTATSYYVPSFPLEILVLRDGNPLPSQLITVYENTTLSRDDMVQIASVTTDSTGKAVVTVISGNRYRIDLNGGGGINTKYYDAAYAHPYVIFTLSTMKFPSAYDYDVRYNDDTSIISMRYSDNYDPAQSVTFKVTRLDTGVIVYENTTTSSTIVYKEFKDTHNTSYRVDMTVVRADGSVVKDTMYVSPSNFFGVVLPFDDRLRNAIFTILLMTSAGFFTYINSTRGAMVVILFAVFLALIGWISIPWYILGAAAAVIVLSALARGVTR